jgi:hypothetical protein
MKNPKLLAPLLLLALSAAAQTAPAHRPPAVPLVTNDPFFSIWSMGDTLTDVSTRHWSGADQRMTGLIRIDGTTYRWMGSEPRLQPEMQISPMHQVSLDITPLHTKYRFEAAGIELRVTFFTPLFPKDLDVLSRPVTYLSWSAAATDGQPHKVDLLLDIDPQIAINDGSEPLTWGRAHAAGLTILNVGSRDQATLHQSGDRVRIDWGYFHLAAPDAPGTTSELSPDAMQQFAANGSLEDMDALDMPRTVGGSQGRAAHLAVELSLGSVNATPVKRHVLLAYTEDYAIEYLGRKLRPYWQRNGMSAAAMFAAAEKEYPDLDARGETFDRELTADMKQVGGDDYAYLTSLAFRQTIAAHKLVADIDGTPMLFSKENDSGGFIDTVDVSYPSSPFFLLFNPKLLQAQLEPTMRYAALPRWPFPFAPHDLGSYPLADGQLYGGGENNETDQMPVEESGNLILMIDAMEREEGNWDFAKRFMPQLTKWAVYLQTKGMDPENQLSTDDFSGHLAHNANLSIKAIEALAAFAEIARGTGDTKLAEHCETLVRPLPAQWEKMASDDGHFKLAFDAPGTWSQKYNLVWDRILDLHLFPATDTKAEWTWYSAHMNPYGLPLDSRKTFTKLDWEVWTASLTDDPQQFHDLIHRLVVWTDATPSRVPLSDWYDTVSGQQMRFQARSVVGGVFLPALLDRPIAEKYLQLPSSPQN